MKQQIKVKHGNEVIEGEAVIRDEDHLKACIKYPSIVYKNKNGYNRKEKHKKDFNED